MNETLREFFRFANEDPGQKEAMEEWEVTLEDGLQEQQFSPGTFCNRVKRRKTQRSE